MEKKLNVSRVSRASRFPRPNLDFSWNA